MDQDALIARLPGNPVSALVALFGIGQRTAERMCSGKATMRPEMLERLAAAVDTIERLSREMDSSAESNVLWIMAARSLESSPVD